MTKNKSCLDLMLDKTYFWVAEGSRYKLLERGTFDVILKTFSLWSAQRIHTDLTCHGFNIINTPEKIEVRS